MKRTRKKISPAGRKAISAAQKARWARTKEAAVRTGDGDGAVGAVVKRLNEQIARRQEELQQLEAAVRILSALGPLENVESVSVDFRPTLPTFVAKNGRNGGKPRETLGVVEVGSSGSATAEIR